MLVKGLGAFFILLASMLWSNLQIARLRARVRQLQEFRLALRLLAAEVGYTVTPLPRAFRQVADMLESREVKEFFTAVCRNLRDAGSAGAEAAWMKAAAEQRKDFDLTERDWAVLTRTAAGLGGLGREDQLKQFTAVEEQLTSFSRDAEERYARGEKMWRYLGVLSGTAMVILLL